MKASGASGELRVGYRKIASLGAWSLDAIASVPTTRFSIEATVGWTDSFWVTQDDPMTLDLQFGRFHWVWESVRPEFENRHVVVKVCNKPTIVKE